MAKCWPQCDSEFAAMCAPEPGLLCRTTTGAAAATGIHRRTGQEPPAGQPCAASPRGPCPCRCQTPQAERPRCRPAAACPAHTRLCPGAAPCSTWQRCGGSLHTGVQLLPQGASAGSAARTEDTDHSRAHLRPGLAHAVRKARRTCSAPARCCPPAGTRWGTRRAPCALSSSPRRHRPSCPAPAASGKRRAHTPAARLHDPHGQHAAKAGKAAQPTAACVAPGPAPRACV